MTCCSPSMSLVDYRSSMSMLNPVGRYLQSTLARKSLASWRVENQIQSFLDTFVATLQRDLPGHPVLRMVVGPAEEGVLEVRIELDPDYLPLMVAAGSEFQPIPGFPVRYHSFASPPGPTGWNDDPYGEV